MAEYKGSVGVGGGLTQLGGGKFAIANAPDIQVDDNGKRLNEWISETTENLREKANSELVEEIKKNVEEKASKEEVEEIKNNLEEQIDEKAPKTAVSSPYNFKGNCLYAELPTSGNEVNDTYYCTDVKTKYTWSGTGWYQSSLDESDYQDELSRVKTIAVSEEEPTNENVVAYINPKRGNPISVVTAEDIAQELGDSEEMVVSQKAITEAVQAQKIKSVANGSSVVMKNVSAIDDVKVKLESDVIKDGTEVTIKTCGKNLISTPYNGYNGTGISFIINDDGSITANGISTATVVKNYIVNTNKPIAKGKYTLSVTSSAEKPVLFAVIGLANENGTIYHATGYIDGANKGEITFGTEATTYSIYIQVAPGAVVDETITVQLEPGAVKSDYEQYIAGEAVNATIGSETALNPISPNMTIMVLSNDVKASVEYFKDSTGIINSIQNEEVERYADGLPVLYLSGDDILMTKDNAVEMQYAFGKRVGSCTLKWQGSSSITFPKKNFTIKFDNKFEIVAGWGSEKKYCIKANYIDHSHVRNVGCAKLWGQIVRNRISKNLGDASINSRIETLPNCGAIDGFPIVIVLNGKFEGLYTFNIPKDAWMFGMGDNSTEAILCADYPASNGTRFQGEANLKNDFEVEYAPNEDETDWIKTSVNRLINACVDSDGTDLDTTISQYVDLDSAIDYYIFVAVVHGMDMMHKNYILATYDGIKWFFSGYDMDSVFGLYVDGKYYEPANTVSTSFVGFSGTHKLMTLIRSYKKDVLKARYQELRETVLSEDNIVTTFTNFVTQIPKNIYDMERKRWSTLPSTETSNIQQIADFCRRRMMYLDKQIESL